MKYKGYLLDLDGTIYLGENKIEAGTRFVKRLQENNIPYLFVTNNTTKTPEHVQHRLTTMFDIDTPVETIYTASHATVDYMNELGREKSAYVIGEQGLKDAVYGAGYIENEENPSYVVVGLDNDLTYDKLTVATLAVQSGATFIGTNPDLNIPTERGLLPGAGSIIKLIEVATRVEPVIIGKPKAVIMDKAVDKLGFDKKDLIMVGDNYLTDINAGIENGIDSLLVLTGFTQKEDVPNLPVAPTYVINSLDDWRF